MTLTLDIVTRAYRKLGIGAEGEALNADALADGITALNSMMHAWKLRGVSLTHADLEASDAFSLGPEFEEGTIYLLASRLSPDYETPAMFDADDWFRGIQAAYAVARVVVMPPGLLRTPTGRRYTGINS